MQVLDHIKWNLLDLKRVRWESPEALSPVYRVHPRFAGVSAAAGNV